MKPKAGIFPRAYFPVFPGISRFFPLFSRHFPQFFNSHFSRRITGGEIHATGSADGAGIGGGQGSNGGTIAIEGGTITAAGGNNAAGIGGGYYGNGGDIDITGGTITAQGGSGGAGIGGGKNASGGTIAIGGDAVITSATGGTDGAGIGGGYHGDGGDIDITGGTITATGGDSGAGIGGGYERGGGNITIGGAAVITSAQGGSGGGAGIGGGQGGSGGTIAIEGGEIHAQGGANAGAGIGGGKGGSDGGNITIEGGEIHAQGGELGAGIGGGGNGGNIEISGGEIHAQGGTASAGIGGGFGAGAAIGDDGGFSADGAEDAISSTLKTLTMVNTATGGGAMRGDFKCVPTTEVEIHAGTKDGNNFAGWTASPSVTFASPASANTTFTMPAADVTITANWGAPPIVATHNVTVVGGTASHASAVAGEQITVTAGAPPAGQQFRNWTASPTVAFAHATAEMTTFTMPDADVTVAANWRPEGGGDLYAVTITGGTASPEIAEAGDQITVTAGEAPAGQRFKNWTASPSVDFADETAETTTFTMPEADVTVTANWEPEGGGPSGGYSRSRSSERPPTPIPPGGTQTTSKSKNSPLTEDEIEKIVNEAIAGHKARIIVELKRASGFTARLSTLRRALASGKPFVLRAEKTARRRGRRNYFCNDQNRKR
jgi:hypothetical protein